jgi:hypothetical protein
METQDAKAVAEKEVIHILLEGKKEANRRETVRACFYLEKKLNEEFNAERHRQKIQDIFNAKHILIKAIRRWLAKQVVKAVCLETFEKIFDMRYNAYYYRNIKTVSCIDSIVFHCSTIIVINLVQI